MDSETASGTSHPASRAIRLRGVGKAYKIFDSRVDNLANALGVDRLMPWYHPRRQEFWALRGIDLDLGKGERVGVIGRNGAGKTTLLKLITRNLSPTVGTVSVHGKVQALMSTGAGFHPDFTGRDNIRAALTLQGFSQRQINESTEDIAAFTELGEFLDRPFKTYSSGMMARLMFATATAIKPEILIIDEILGAGDAYFLGKSNERMRNLVESGASILLVSHSMEQISLICNQAIWLDRGRIVKRGSSLDVTSAYSQFLRILEDRRKRARNQKVTAGRRLPNDVMESYSDTTLVHFVVPAGERLELARVKLLRGGVVEEECRVGDAQDSERTAAAFVVLAGSAWGRPELAAGTHSRAIQGSNDGEATAQVAINLLAIYPKVVYSLEIEYRLPSGSAGFEVWVSGASVGKFTLSPTGQEFETATFVLPELVSPSTSAPRAKRRVTEVVPDGPLEVEERVSKPVRVESENGRTRWPGEGSILIDGVELVGFDGREHAVFEHGETMCLRMIVKAVRAGAYPVVPVAVLYRSDGVKVSTMIGEAISLDVGADEIRRFDLDLGSLYLGNGQYAFAVAIYRRLDANGESAWYDLIDRDYRFELIGAPPFMGIVEHPARWTMS